MRNYRVAGRTDLASVGDNFHRDTNAIVPSRPPRNLDPYIVAQMVQTGRKPLLAEVLEPPAGEVRDIGLSKVHQRRRLRLGLLPPGNLTGDQVCELRPHQAELWVWRSKVSEDVAAARGDGLGRSFIGGHSRPFLVQPTREYGHCHPLAQTLI